MLVSESWRLRKTVSCITGHGADSHIRPGSVVSQAVVQTQTLGLGLAGLILASLFLPQRSGGAWSTGEVSQLTQAAGLVYSFMLGRPGCLESEGGCPPSS